MFFNKLSRIANYAGRINIGGQWKGGGNEPLILDRAIIFKVRVATTNSNLDE